MTSGKSVTSAQTIPSASKTAQRRFVAVEDERALASQSAMSVADSFSQAGEIRGSE
jgi:hypothetical protein